MSGANALPLHLYASHFALHRVVLCAEEPPAGSLSARVERLEPALRCGLGGRGGVSKGVGVTEIVEDAQSESVCICVGG